MITAGCKSETPVTGLNPTNTTSTNGDAAQGSNTTTVLSSTEIARADQNVSIRATSRKPKGIQDLTFDDLKFDIEKDAPFHREMLPEKIEDLKTAKIRLRGYILPGFKPRGITEFVLVRDNLECCFGPGAALYDCVLVRMEGKGIDFTVRPITVEGQFDIEEFKGGGGKTRAIYKMSGMKVK